MNCPCNTATSREAAMVVVRKDDTGKPTVWCDPCIAPIVRALNDAGMPTTWSCCGHGNRPGMIGLQDGRQVMILPDLAAAHRAEAVFTVDINGITRSPDGTYGTAPGGAMTREIIDELKQYAGSWHDRAGNAQPVHIAIAEIEKLRAELAKAAPVAVPPGITADDLKRESERLLKLGVYYAAAPDMAAHIAKLQAALDEARKDAGRWSLLREHFDSESDDLPHWLYESGDGNDLDARADAAMERKS